MRTRVHSHYETLRVDRRASAQLVRLAYRRMAQKFHPDRFEGRGDSGAAMAQINQAYAVLSDAAQRTAYDEWLAGEEARLARPRTHGLTPASTGGDAATPPASVPLPAWGGGWSWYLLFGVLALTVVTLGYVALRSRAPSQPRLMPAVQAAPSPVAVDMTPLAPLPKIDPWTEPPRSTHRPLAETEPVARLVRDGVLTRPAPRRAEGGSGR